MLKKEDAALEVSFFLPFVAAVLSDRISRLADTEHGGRAAASPVHVIFRGVLASAVTRIAGVRQAGNASVRAARTAALRAQEGVRMHC